MWYCLYYLVRLILVIINHLKIIYEKITPPLTKILPVLILFALSVVSCQKKFEMNTPSKPEEVRFPQTAKEEHTVSILKEVGKILQEIYKSPKPYFEVNAAIYSEYYEDERVLLKDLLFPEINPLYHLFSSLGHPTLQIE